MFNWNSLFLFQIKIYCALTQNADDISTQQWQWYERRFPFPLEMLNINSYYRRSSLIHELTAVTNMTYGLCKVWKAIYGCWYQSTPSRPLVVYFFKPAYFSGKRTQKRTAFLTVNSEFVWTKSTIFWDENTKYIDLKYQILQIHLTNAKDIKYTDQNTNYPSTLFCRTFTFCSCREIMRMRFGTNDKYQVWWYQ